MISSAHRSEHDNIFLDKNMDRKHFSEKYELSTMKNTFKNKKRAFTNTCKTLVFTLKMTIDQAFHRKLLNYKIEKKLESFDYFVYFENW